MPVVFFMNLLKIMLTQNVSKILKSDFSFWKKEESSAVKYIYNETALISNLSYVQEIVIDELGSYKIAVQENTQLMILPLFGQVSLNGVKKPVITGESILITSISNRHISIKNILETEKTDILIFEFKTSNASENLLEINTLNFENKNVFFPISKSLNYPNFIGLYDGRQEDVYRLKQSSSAIFGLVINGAFEFQNRLMENRDAIIIWDINEIEFEALSEHALIIFIEILK